MSEKFCKDCGQSLVDGVRFCSACGQPVVGSPRPALDRGKSGGSWLRDGLIFVGLIVLVGGVYWAMREEPVQERPAQISTPPDHEGMGAALANLPTDYNSLVAGGNDQMDAGNFPMAAELYRRALAIDGGSPDVRTDFGACLHSMGLAERALEEFRKVYSEHPDHSIVRYNMGIVHYGLGQQDSARQYWEEFLRVAPEGGAAEKAREYLSGLGS